MAAAGRRSRVACRLPAALSSAPSALAARAALSSAPSALAGQAARGLCTGFPSTPKWQKLGEPAGPLRGAHGQTSPPGRRWASLSPARRGPIRAATGRRRCGCAASHRPHTPLRPALPPAEYATLEVWDTSEVDALAGHLKRERARLFEVYRVAKEEQRKVVWKDAQFDLRRLDRLEGWVEQVRKDPRRAW
eukprot:scaffold4526_cov89-Isochrysis_galbana.AAC.3